MRRRVQECRAHDPLYGAYAQAPSTAITTTARQMLHAAPVS